MTNYRHLARAGAATVALAVAATACGGGGNSSSSPKTGSSGSTGKSDVYQASDKKGGTLQLLNSSDCDYWDPQRTYYAFCWNMQRLLSRGLMMYDSKPGPAKVVPDLAASEPQISDGQKTWKYTLKDGIKFQDGTPITSKDIKYGIERVFATDVINGGPTYVIDELVGGSSYKGPYKNKAGLASIQTPDDKTIIFKLKRPFSDWNYVMAMPTSTPVPQAKDTGTKYTFAPVATGPYKIEKYTPNKVISFVRNENWSNDTVRKALPDKVIMTMGLDPNDIDNRLASDQADVDAGGTGVQIATQAKILTNQQLQARSDNPLTGFLRFIGIFTKVKPFDNVHCRKAVAYIVNKKAQQLSRGGPKGGGDIATTMSPPTLQFYQKFDLYPENAGTGNVEKAKAELAACGQPNGFTTKIATRNKGKEVKQAEALQADLQKIGIKATIDQFDASQYYSAQVGIPAQVHKQKFGMMFGGWGPDWPAPYGFYHFIVDGRSILPQGNSNYPELNLPAINNGIDSALAATDDATRQTQWTNVDKAVVDSAGYVPFLYDKALDLHSSRLTNAFITAAFGMYDYAALGVMK